MKKIIAVALFTLGMANSASASLIEWTFNNATFDDGASLTGSFVWDTVNGEIDDGNLLTGTSATFTGATYTPSTVPNVDIDTTINRILFDGPNALYVWVDIASLDTAVSQLNLLSTNGGFYECPSANVCSPFREGTGTGYLSGRLVPGATIPLPAGAPLLLTGIAGFAWLRRRKSKRA